MIRRGVDRRSDRPRYGAERRDDDESQNLGQKRLLWLNRSSRRHPSAFRGSRWRHPERGVVLHVNHRVHLPGFVHEERRLRRGPPPSRTALHYTPFVIFNRVDPSRLLLSFPSHRTLNLTLFSQVPRFRRRPSFPALPPRDREVLGVVFRVLRLGRRRQVVVVIVGIAFPFHRVES